MAKVGATASLGMKLSLGGKEGFTQYDNASPHGSISIEREVPEGLTDQDMAHKASEVYDLCRKLVEKKVNEDIRDIKGKDLK